MIVLGFTTEAQRVSHRGMESRRVGLYYILTIFN